MLYNIQWFFWTYFSENKRRKFINVLLKYMLALKGIQRVRTTVVILLSFLVCTRYLLRQRTLGEYLLEQSCLPAIKVSVNHCIDELNYQSWKRDIIFYINRVLTKIWEREVRGVVTVIFLCIKRNIYNHVDDVSFLGWIWCHTSAPYNISSMASLMTSSMNSLLKKKISLMNQQAFENFQIDKLFCLSI